MSNVIPFIAAPRPDHAPPYRLVQRDEPLVDLYASFAEEREGEEGSLLGVYTLIGALGGFTLLVGLVAWVLL